MSDGRRIVSGSKDQSLKVWDLVTLQCCMTLKGHTDLIWRVAVASDDSFIVSASKDDMLKVSRLVFRLDPFCSHLELHDTVADIAEQPLCDLPLPFLPKLKISLLPSWLSQMLIFPSILRLTFLQPPAFKLQTPVFLSYVFALHRQFQSREQDRNTPSLTLTCNSKAELSLFIFRSGIQ